MIAFSITYEMLFWVSLLLMFCSFAAIVFTDSRNNKMLCVYGIGVILLLVMAVGCASMDIKQCKLEAKEDYKNHNVDAIQFLDDYTYKNNILDLYIADMMQNPNATLSDRFGD